MNVTEIAWVKGSILIISSTSVYCNEICNEVNRLQVLITPICTLRCDAKITLPII